MQLTHRDVKRILELVDGAASIGEIEFVHNGLHFRFVRDTTPAPRQTTTPSAPPLGPVAVQTKQLRAHKEVLVRAPAAGRFYRSPASDQGALVNDSTRAETNLTIAVIKTAMHATAVQPRVDGVVKRTFANDGEFVEFDQPLFIVAVT